jgi:signal transduction histidine kinase
VSKAARAVRRRRGNYVGRRLVLYTICFSSLITLAITAAQLVFEYRELRRSLDTTLDGVAIYVPSIAGSLWDFDDRQIQLAVQALARLPQVDHAVVRGEAARQWSAGDRTAGRLVTRSYPLTHLSRGQLQQIGTLEVVGSLDTVYRQLAERALSIAFSNAVKTFLVALFMLGLLRRLVTLRLEELGARVTHLVPRLMPLRRVVEPDPQPLPSQLDELDAVDWALDRTTADLSVAVGELQRLNRELEVRVGERTRDLETANRDLQAFGYTLSHDLQAPLITMRSFAGVLRAHHGGQLDEKAAACLARIEAAARRMEEIIADTLRLFTVSAAALHAQRVDIAPIAREVLDGLQRCHPDRRVNWSVEGPLPAWGDPHLLRAALENLIGNAWKYTARCETARIRVGAFRDGEALGFVVEDNGAGFDMAEAGRLFEPFQRLHKDPVFPGNGIGLSAVRRIVQRHQGRIWAEAEPGAGARFFFTLGPEPFVD